MDIRSIHRLTFLFLLKPNGLKITIIGTCIAGPKTVTQCLYKWFVFHLCKCNCDTVLCFNQWNDADHWLGMCVCLVLFGSPLVRWWSLLCSVYLFIYFLWPMAIYWMTVCFCLKKVVPSTQSTSLIYYNNQRWCRTMRPLRKKLTALVGKLF